MKAIKLSFGENSSVVDAETNQTNFCFDDYLKLNVLDDFIIKSDGFLNVCYVSNDLVDKFGPIALLYNTDTSVFREVSLVANSSIHGNDVKITPTIKNQLSYEPGESSLVLIKYRFLKFSKIKTQKIENIKEDIIEISEKDANSFTFESSKFGINFFTLTNTVTNQSIIIKKTHIVINSELPEGCIRINRKQRIFLGFDVPLYIEDYLWNQLISKIDKESLDYNLFISAYDNDHNLKQSVTYNDKVEITKIISKYLKPNLILTPIVECYKKTNPFLKFFIMLTNFYVGKSTISLLAKRPYEVDEGKDIIRISETNMNLLGITEMDQVKITYKGKTAKCRVMVLKDGNSKNETNRPISSDIMVGLPVNIRNKLGIMNLYSSVKIDRDTPFIFKKSINEQIVPILLTLFSADAFTNFELWKAALISLAAIPLVVYFNLSSKRNMRLK